MKKNQIDFHEKKNILLNAYLSKNLGDDLFIKLITERYNENFIAYATTKYSKNIFPNLKIKSGIIFRIIRKLSNLLLGRNLIQEYYNKKSDLMITIGGSLFVESDGYKKYYNEKYVGYLKDHYMIGVNFGPYYSQEFFEFVKKNIIKSAQDVCFRDNYSYQLFSDCENVRKATDILFSFDTNSIKIKDEKKVVISVMDCNKGIGSQYKEIYETKILELTKEFINKGYQVFFMAFCKRDGDEEAIKSILKRADKNIKKKIQKCTYNGKNMEEILYIIANSQIVIGTRFHANILGLLFGKSIIPFAYNIKTINILKDMNYSGEILEIQKLDNYEIKDALELACKCEIKEKIKEAEKQFEILDKILKKESE